MLFYLIRVRQVIDEADRLLAQSFQEWLAQVLAAIQPPARKFSRTLVKETLLPGSDDNNDDEDDEDIEGHDALAPAWLHSHPSIPDVITDLDDKKTVSCQKLLFSATLTRDPSKIAAIGLKDPKYFIVQSAGANDEGQAMLVEESFAMPATLTVCLNTSIFSMSLVFNNRISYRNAWLSVIRHKNRSCFSTSSIHTTSSTRLYSPNQQNRQIDLYDCSNTSKKHVVNQLNNQT